MKPEAEKDISEAVKSLNCVRAPYICGVAAEHVYFVGLKILDIIKNLINDIILNHEVPVNIKLGILTPIFKNNAS